jgi:hypothetical protein
LFCLFIWWCLTVLLVKETTGPGENHRPVASHWQTLSHNVVHFGNVTVSYETTFAALHSRKDIEFISFVEDLPVFHKNVCKNLLFFLYFIEKYSIFLHETWNMTRHIFWRHWRMTSKERKRTSRNTKKWKLKTQIYLIQCHKSQFYVMCIS